jgi:hypothetical protein
MEIIDKAVPGTSGEIIMEIIDKMEAMVLKQIDVPFFWCQGGSGPIQASLKLSLKYSARKETRLAAPRSGQGLGGKQQ